MLVVDFEVPESTPDYLDFAPIAKRSTQLEEVSVHQRGLFECYNAVAATEKLMPYLGPQHEVGLHVALLQFYVQHMGVIVTKVHRAWSWRQSSWLKPYVEGISAKRAASDDAVLKQTLKDTMNSLFGKTLENKEGYQNINVYVDHDKFIRAHCQPLAEDWDIFDDSPSAGFLGIVKTAKTNVCLDTPRLVGFSILYLAKLLMYRAHYLVMKPRYSPRLRLLMMDTDSFIYHLETEDAIADMRTMNTDYCKYRNPLRFDLSKRDPSCPHKGEPGALKCEPGLATVQEYVGLQAKMYSLHLYTGDVESEESKAKGLSKRALYAIQGEKERKLHHDLYRRVLYGGLESSASYVAIRSKRQRLQHVEQSKKGLSCYNDKVYQLNTSFARPLGHWRNLRTDGSDSVGGMMEGICDGVIP